MAHAAVVLNQQETIVNQAAQSLTTDGDSGSLDASGFNQILASLKITSFSGSASSHFYLDGLGPDGSWYQLFQFSDVAGNVSLLQALGPPYTSVGNVFITATIRLRWVLNGNTFTLAYWLLGQSV